MPEQFHTLGSTIFNMSFDFDITTGNLTSRTHVVKDGLGTVSQIESFTYDGYDTDNNVQDPLNGQNYNRYSYVLNNPLKYTDPTGETRYGEDFSYTGPIYGGGSHSSEWARAVYIDGEFAGFQLGSGLFGNMVSGGGGAGGGGGSSSYLSSSLAAINFMNQSGGMHSYWGSMSSYNRSGIGSFQAQSGGNELGPIGFGLSVEIGFPDWVVGQTIAFGFDIGLVADNTSTGIGLYLTTKTPIGNPVAFSIAPEVFYAHSSFDNQIKIKNLNGEGFEITGSIGANGGSYGFNNEGTYQILTTSGFSRGIDFGSGSWKTNTSVYTIDMLMD
jgi:hypothetical protein